MNRSTTPTLFPERRLVIPSHIPPALHERYREIVRRLELVEPGMESEAEIQVRAGKVLMEQLSKGNDLLDSPRRTQC